MSCFEGCSSENGSAEALASALLLYLTSQCTSEINGMRVGGEAAEGETVAGCGLYGALSTPNEGFEWGSGVHGKSKMSTCEGNVRCTDCRAKGVKAQILMRGYPFWDMHWLLVTEKQWAA